MALLSEAETVIYERRAPTVQQLDEIHYKQHLFYLEDELIKEERALRKAIAAGDIGSWILHDEEIAIIQDEMQQAHDRINSSRILACIKVD